MSNKLLETNLSSDKKYIGIVFEKILMLKTSQ